MSGAVAAVPVVVVVGSLNLDLVGRAPRIPGPGETVLGTSLARSFGGKGGNQAVAAARLGAAVRFFGALGCDAAGDEMLAALVAEGIDCTGVVRVVAPSGTALITVSASGENAITVLPGANLEVPAVQATGPAGTSAATAVRAADAADAANAASTALRDARYLLLQLEIPLAVNRAWAAAARALQVPVLLNAAPANEDARTLLPLTDLLLVNEGELAQLGADEATLGPPTVVTTLGERGCRAWHRGRVLAVPAVPVPVQDTTGAGDTFAGALAAALAAGRSLAEALAEANLAAALSCRRPGARGGMPTRAELDAARAAAA